MKALNNNVLLQPPYLLSTLLVALVLNHKGHETSAGMQAMFTCLPNKTSALGKARCSHALARWLSRILPKRRRCLRSRSFFRLALQDHNKKGHSEGLGLHSTA